MSTVTGGLGTTITDGLVLYLDAANTRSYPGTGTSWADLSRSGNHGILNGATFNSAEGGSIVFNGINNYFTTNTQFAIPTNNRTFDIWVKFITLGTTSNYSPILTQTPAFNHTNSSNISGLQKLNTNFNIAQPVGNGSQFNAYSNGFSYSPYINTWINIVGTIEGGIASKIYLNTSLVSNVNININPIQSANHITMGFFPGPQFQVSIARVYNRVLSTIEILQNYNIIRNRFGV